MMWGWWDTGQSNRTRFIIAASIAALVLGLVLFFGLRYGVWWLFFLFPLFGGWGRSRRRDRERYESRRYSARSTEDDKRKNDEWDDDVYEEEKPKRAEYRLGDDGELVEVEPEREERQSVPRSSARRINGDDPIEYI